MAKLSNDMEHIKRMNLLLENLKVNPGQSEKYLKVD